MRVLGVSRHGSHNPEVPPCREYVSNPSTLPNTPLVAVQARHICASLEWGRLGGVSAMGRAAPSRAGARWGKTARTSAGALDGCGRGLLRSCRRHDFRRLSNTWVP